MHKIDIDNYNFDKNVFIQSDKDKENLIILFQAIDKIKHLETLFNSNSHSRYEFYNNVKNLKLWIIDKTKFLDDLIKEKFKISFKTRCYWLVKGNKNLEFCKNPNCKTNISLTQNVVSIMAGYRDYCCVKCVNNDPLVRQQICDTKEDRYGDPTYNNREKAWNTTEKHFGVRNPFQAKEIKERIIETHQKNLSVDYPMQNKEVQNKSKSTMQKKYGVDFPLQLLDILNKSKQTNFDRYGYENPMQNPDFKEKARQTCYNHYGTYTPMQSSIVMEKAISSFIAHYGTSNNMKSEIGQLAYKQAFFDKYGVYNPMQVSDIRAKCAIKYIYNNKNFDSSSEIAYYIYLVDHSIKFEYQPSKSFEYIYANKKHFYIPDFFLIDENQYVELKGPHFFTKNGTMFCPYRDSDMTDEDYLHLNELFEAKHQCMLKNNVKIIRTDSLEMQKIMNYIAEKYGKDYLKQFRNK